MIPHRSSSVLSRGFSLAAVLSVLVAPSIANAQSVPPNTINFCDFSNLQVLPQLLQANGDATFSSNVIRLTPNETNRKGSVFTKAPLPLTATTNFNTHFRFRMTPNAGPDGGPPGGDGFVFVLQNKNPGATALGGSAGASLGWNGIQPSIGVEFDTVQDNGDPSGNHVAIMQDGDRNTHLAAATPSFNLKGTSLSDVRDAWVDYIAATTTLNVYVAPNGTKPALPTVSFSGINLATHLGGQAYVGFTAATGGNGETNDHEITYFVMNATGPLVDCIPCFTDAQCVGTPTPACQPSGFCGECSASNSNACDPGEVCDVPSGTCVPANDGGTGDGGVVLPDGGVVLPDGGVVLPDGGVVLPDGGVVLPDGGVVLPDGGVVLPDGGVVLPDGGVLLPDGGILLPDGGVIDIPDGGVVLPDGGILLPDGGVISPDGGETDAGADGGNTLDGGDTDASNDGGETDGGDLDGATNDGSTSEDASLGNDASATADGSISGDASLGSDGSLSSGDGSSSGTDGGAANGSQNDGTFLEGGGCACSTPGSGAGGTSSIGFGLMTMVGLAFAARRRQNRR